MDGAFYEPDGTVLRSTVLTRGPWDERFQHGGPPCALLARALEGFAGGEDFPLARMTVTFLGPVPIGAIRVRVSLEHGGRATQRLGAVLEADGREVLVATGLRIRRAATEVSGGPDPAALSGVWPDPEALASETLTFFPWEDGYHRVVDLRIAEGAWGLTPVRFWARPVVPLVAGEATSPRQAVVVVADAQSGMGPPLDPLAFNYANPDLTVAFARTPVAGWTGLDIRSLAGADGAGLAQSLLVDADGLFGGCSQSLVISPRR